MHCPEVFIRIQCNEIIRHNFKLTNIKKHCKPKFGKTFLL